MENNDLISRSELHRMLSSWDWQDLYLPVHFSDLISEQKAVDAVPVVHGPHCIDIVDFIDWLDVGNLRSADEKCFSEANVAGMLKDYAITNPAIPATVTRCKDCRYGLPCKLFGRDAITCTEHREEIHLMDWYCADAAKMDGKDDAK